MNLYREIKADEIIDNINMLFEEYGVVSFDDKKGIVDSVLTSSKNATKRIIRTKVSRYYDSRDVQELCNRLFKLYKALGLTNSGQKLYTDL